VKLSLTGTLVFGAGRLPDLDSNCEGTNQIGLPFEDPFEPSALGLPASCVDDWGRIGREPLIGGAEEAFRISAQRITSEARLQRSSSRPRRSRRDTVPEVIARFVTPLRHRPRSLTPPSRRTAGKVCANPALDVSGRIVRVGAWTSGPMPRREMS
jgi:hypothetical protein